MSKKFINITLIAVALGITATILLYYYWFNPKQKNNFSIPCSFKAYTGLDCVGCGGQRAIYAMLHGDFMQAADYNVLFILMIPLLFFYGFFSIRKMIFDVATPRHFFYKKNWGLILIIILITFMIVRNLPIQEIQWMNSSH